MRSNNPFNSDAPSPLVGEGWGEGDSEHFTLSLALSHQGRGNRFRASQRGVTLIELVIALVISAIILASLNSLVKLGLDAQAIGRSSNELAYQGRFALERITDKARVLTPKDLISTPTANTTGDWFAPTACTGAACLMYCRNATTNQLIETTTADTTCTGTTTIANNVSGFAATLPASMGAVDRRSMVISITLSDASNTLTLTSNIRLGGGLL